MKKDILRTIAVGIISLIVYNLIAFAVPFNHTAAFWVSYGFTMFAIILVFIATSVAFLRDPEAKSRFYGFPIARVAVIYGVAQITFSLLVMLVAKWIPWWVPTVLYAVGLGAALIGLISVEAVVEHVQTQDEVVKVNVQLMRSLQSKVNQLAAQTENAAVKELAEELRYSDPVSSEAIADAEADLEVVVDQIQNAYINGDTEAMERMCRKANVLLAERNRLCKLNKK